MKKYIIGILLLILNLFAFQNGISPIVFFTISLSLIIMFFMVERSEKKRLYLICLELLCFCWPFSWTNIFGGNTTDNPITWFYIIGLVFFIIYFLKHRDGILTKNGKIILPMVVIGSIYSFLPLAMSFNFFNGLADFIMIEFFLVLCFVSITSKENITKEELENIIDVFIFVNFISSFVLIFQYLIYKSVGFILFKMNIAGSFSSSAMQIGSELLFEDSSSATIMLGCGVIFSLIRASKLRKNYIFALIILIGMALTGRRTGVVALMLTIPFFFMSFFKKISTKIISIGLMGIIFMLLVYFISLSRPFDNVADLFNNNGRFVDYIESIKLIKEKPLGIGYGDDYLESFMQNHIPHNTFLRWMNFGGFFLAMPLLTTIFGAMYNSYKVKNEYCFWGILYSFLASNFIPDILNARFLTILVVLAFIYRGENHEIR